MTTRDELLANGHLKNKGSGLIKIIEEASSIEDSEKLLYIEMAKDFDKDFENNLFATSLALNKLYPYGLDVWQTFLTNPQIAHYIGSFTQEILEKQADLNIKTGTNVRDAAHIKKQLSGKSKGQDNFGFIIMYINEEEDRNYEAADAIGD